MRNLGYILLLMLLMSNLSSCFNDKGNYDYIEIQEAVIKAIPGVTDNGNRLVCLENEQIKLKPELEFKAGSTAEDYEFIWFRFPKKPQGTSGHYEQADTLAMTQNLDYKIVNSPRDYWVVYKVIHKKTHALSEQKFEFIISAVNGWIVLDEDGNGHGDLQIIRDKDIVSGGDGRVINNYYSQNNGGNKIHNGRFIAYCNYLTNMYIYSEQGAYILDASTYIERPDKSYADLFSSVVSLDVINPQAEYYDRSGGNTEVLVNDYKIYKVSYRMMGQTQFTEATGVGEYKAAPSIAPIRVAGSSNCAVLFDMLNNRFLTIGTWGNLAAPASASGVFNIGAVNPEWEYIYLGEGKDGETCLVMKDDTGIRYLLRANLVSKEPVAVACVNLEKLPDIKESAYYAFGIRGEFMFYATHSKVYTWRFGKETASDFLSVADGEEIVGMKLYNNPDDNSMNGKILFIATRKEGKGKIYKVLFNEMNGMPLAAPKVYSGFGIIKDMFYKS